MKNFQNIVVITNAKGETVTATPMKRAALLRKAIKALYPGMVFTAIDATFEAAIRGIRKADRQVVRIINKYDDSPEREELIKLLKMQRELHEATVSMYISEQNESKKQVNVILYKPFTAMFEDENHQISKNVFRYGNRKVNMKTKTIQSLVK